MLSRYIVNEFRTGEMKKVILVDKNENVKKGLRNIINSIDNYKVEEMITRFEGLDMQALTKQDIILFELTPGNLKKVKTLSGNIRFTSAKLIGMKSIDNPELEKRAFLSGINGVIDKSSPQKQFEEMFSAVNAKGVYFNREILQLIRKDYHFEKDKSLKKKFFKAINFIKGVQL